MTTQQTSERSEPDVRTPTFSGRHYFPITDAMAASQPPESMLEERRQHYKDCKALADMLLADNPIFSVKMFLDLCGGYEP